MNKHNQNLLDLKEFLGDANFKKWEINKNIIIRIGSPREYFITDAFGWEGSPEGLDFWNKLNAKWQQLTCAS